MYLKDIIGISFCRVTLYWKNNTQGLLPLFFCPPWGLIPPEFSNRCDTPPPNQKVSPHNTENFDTPLKNILNVWDLLNMIIAFHFFTSSASQCKNIQQNKNYCLPIIKSQNSSKKL